MIGQNHQMIAFPGDEGPVPAYLALPDDTRPHPAVLVIHEIHGLTPHIQRVADRFAAQGYAVLAPNLFSRPGLAEVMNPEALGAFFQFRGSIQPERMGDPAYMQAELEKLPPERRELVRRVIPVMSGGLPRESFLRDLAFAVDFLKAQPYANGQVASIGFCFGGGMSFNLACRAVYDAAVVFYGDNPSPLDLVQNIACPVLGIYGAEDLRINDHLDELVSAIVRYKKDFEMKIYPGAAHAFFNETNVNGYREAAAQDAWERVLRFFDRALLQPARQAQGDPG